MKDNYRGLARERGLAAVVLAAFALAGTVVPLSADSHEIVWGGSVPLTGIYAQAGQFGYQGMNAYVAYLNATGGTDGRLVRLVTQDSGSVPEQSLAIFKWREAAGKELLG